MELFNTTEELILTTETYGSVLKKGIGYDRTHKCKREIDVYTVIKVKGFNFATHKIVISCIKGIDIYDAEVTLGFLLKHCSVTTPDPNQEIKAIMVKHTKHNYLDKETAMFLLIMLLTYIVGHVIGRGL